MSSTIIKTQVVPAQINKKEPHRVFGKRMSMYLGKEFSNDIYRMLFKFPISMIPDECYILKAELKIYVQCAGTYKGSSFTPYALEENWSVDTVTWNNQPCFYPNISGESKYMTCSTFYTFNITDMVCKWYNNEIPNYGLIIKNKEIRNQTYKQISTMQNGSLSPVVEICYMHKSCIFPPICTRFIEKREELDTNELYSFSSIINTSLTKTITYHIENLGDTPVEILLQVAANTIDFIDDCSCPRLINPHEIIWVTPYSFAKFTRIAAKNVNPGETSRIRIWYQAQE